MLRHRPARLWLAALLGATAMLVPAGTASASFHLMSVREVFAGVSTGSKEEYVELQMYAAGQNQIELGTLRLYDASGNQTLSVTPTGPVPNSANQSTVLFATTSAESALGVTADVSLGNADSLSLAGGAACWANVDCVSWGNFNNTTLTPLPSPTGTPVDPAGIPDGMAIRRTIAPNCSTLLEAADDSNDSATDFFNTTPAPRNNASPITETACSGGGGGGGGGDTTPPQTTIKKLKVDSAHHKATVRFGGSDNSSGKLSFKCKLDKGKFKACTSPKTFKHLKRGRHKVRVEAIDAAGNVDSTPATKSFRIA